MVCIAGGMYSWTTAALVAGSSKDVGLTGGNGAGSKIDGLGGNGGGSEDDLTGGIGGGGSRNGDWSNNCGNRPSGLPGILGVGFLSSDRNKSKSTSWNTSIPRPRSVKFSMVVSKVSLQRRSTLSLSPGGEGVFILMITDGLTFCYH